MEGLRFGFGDEHICIYIYIDAIGRCNTLACGLLIKRLAWGEKGSFRIWCEMKWETGAGLS